MTIGCLFGSFDPPHLGHVAIAEQMLKAGGLDQVWLVVTPQNPFKQDRKLSPDQHRLAMTRLAVQGKPGLNASGFELDLPKPNYTVDTLAFMRQRWPDLSFVLIIGSDNLASLHQWKDADQILAHHRVLVYPRPGMEEHLQKAELADHPQVTVVPDLPQMEVSSTGIRVRIRNWKPLAGLVDPAVEAYIRQYGLYNG
ncbi:MAG: nicotinate-nucleotide adenylyltransferase [Flavobacteriales bacterium]|nr:nicotinate-nucleotide adenylyltransferase [Flavobacteriales bacterium]